MLKFTINDFLDLRLEDGKTHIYVNNKLLLHCKYVLLNFSLDQIDDLDDIDSIDNAVEKLYGYFEVPEDENIRIPPETIFWAHCSNLQTWYENNYNTSLIHSNLAFPLLKELTKVGDYLAAKVFKEEVARRFESNNMNVIKFLLYNKYLDCLNQEELEIILDNISFNLTNIAIRQLDELMKSVFANYREIKDVIDILLFYDLNYNQFLIIHILNNLSKKYRVHFTQLLILHLNYKEFLDYRIPYGKFLTYFEEILDFLYENYPEINDLLKIIDSGFNSGAYSLDEKRSYGFVSYLGKI